MYVVADAFAGRLTGLGAFRGRRAFDYFALGLVCVFLVTFYGAAYRGSAPWAGLAAKIFAPIANAPLLGNPGGETPPPAWTGNERLNVLLLGIDSRPGDTTTQNTDTMIVLSLDPLNKTAAMLSIPRDVYINRPGLLTDKINAAYAFGGADLAKRVVEDLLGIHINSYALVDFDAFTKMRVSNIENEIQVQVSEIQEQHEPLGARQRVRNVLQQYLDSPLPREQADLDRGGGALLGHLVELSVGKQEHAASLGDPVDAHFKPLRLLEHRL